MNAKRRYRRLRRRRLAAERERECKVADVLNRLGNPKGARVIVNEDGSVDVQLSGD